MSAVHKIHSNYERMFRKEFRMLLTSILFPQAGEADTHALLTLNVER